jgi:hypothetical protein
VKSKPSRTAEDGNRRCPNRLDRAPAVERYSSFRGGGVKSCKMEGGQHRSLNSIEVDPMNRKNVAPVASEMETRTLVEKTLFQELSRYRLRRYYSRRSDYFWRAVYRVRKAWARMNRHSLIPLVNRLHGTIRPKLAYRSMSNLIIRIVVPEMPVAERSTYYNALDYALSKDVRCGQLFNFVEKNGGWQLCAALNRERKRSAK